MDSSCEEVHCLNEMDNNDYNGLTFKAFRFTDHSVHDFEQDIDPENNFLNSLKNNCCYYSEDQFNRNIESDHGISVIHFNSRSLYANFHNIKE